MSGLGETVWSHASRMRWLVAAACSLTVGRAAVHEYHPERYSLIFSSEKPPVLRLKPGDTVQTTTVDSEGRDETGRAVGPKYNALTGPFYIEGARPGDTLVVYLEQVRLNSKRGSASTRIGDNAITPREFAKGMAGAKGYFWTIDSAITPQEFAKGTAGGKGYYWEYDLERMIGSTNVTPRLSRLKLPLRPFPGCIGVAPAHEEALSARFAGDHGGNLDYNALVEGTKLYFPVNVEGALFYFGDGHAAQGDGESSGGAVETTLAVRFRVELQSKQQIPSLRAESEEFHIAIGVGDPLDRAYQRATANMVHWLTQGFGLDRQEAYVLIGTTAQFDIASIASDRGNTVACKIPRKLLRQVVEPGPR